MRPRRIRRGELALERASLHGGRALQCGHGEFAVENLPARTNTVRGTPASMRPRRIRRGEPVRRGSAGRGWTGFNAATANSPWRTQPLASRRRVGRWRLQCGHGEFAVENQGKGCINSWSLLASMRPRRIRRGEHGRRLPLLRLYGGASMRPRRIRRGEPLLCSWPRG